MTKLINLDLIIFKKIICNFVIYKQKYLNKINTGKISLYKNATKLRKRNSKNHNFKNYKKRYIIYYCF